MATQLGTVYRLNWLKNNTSDFEYDSLLDVSDSSEYLSDIKTAFIDEQISQLNKCVNEFQAVKDHD